MVKIFPVPTSFCLSQDRYVPLGTALDGPTTGKDSKEGLGTLASLNPGPVLHSYVELCDRGESSLGFRMAVRV